MRWSRQATLVVSWLATIGLGGSYVQGQTKTTPAAKPAVGPAAPPAAQSTHYPILLIATGSNPGWGARIGLKGLERLERAGYPPIVLEGGEIAEETPRVAWSYRAKDTAAGAEVTLHLTRTACTDGTTATKYTFGVVLNHAQIGELKGCARIAAEEFPEFKQKNLDDDDPLKKKPALPGITKFAAPVAVAYLDATGKVIFSRGSVKKVVAPKGSELAVSHDGKKLLFTRGEGKAGAERALVLYEWDTGRSKELQRGLVQQACWSPDDNRVAFLEGNGSSWQVWSLAVNSPEKAVAWATTGVSTLDGWVDGHTVLAADEQNLYWLSEDKPQQSVALRDLYGEAFQIKSADTIRMNPTNPDLLLVSADYRNVPAGAATDTAGTAAGLFLYEVRAKRRVVVSPVEQWARGGEWSRDGLQIFYTRRVNAHVAQTFRIFWDGSGVRHYQDGTELVVGQ